MADVQNLVLASLAFAAGVALHLVVFRVGEWDRAYNKPAGLYAFIAVGGAAYTHFISSSGEVALLDAFRTILYLELVSVAGIFSSILVYRVFFHRLNRFPGPFATRVSNWWVTSRSIKNLRLYEEIELLHQQYGDFVRVGPREISINNVEAINQIHGATTKCVKGPWYSLNRFISLQTDRVKPSHAKRRRAWDRGFNAKALREYEPRVVKYTDQLLLAIEKRAGKPIDASDWFNFYSFDVMGDLAFGARFDMLAEGVKHYFMVTLHSFMRMIGMFSHAVWLLPIFQAIPILNAEDKKFFGWICQQTESRRRNRPDRPDVFSWVLEDFETKKTPSYQDELDLIGDAYLIAVAGSDTTAATLSVLFFELAQRPDIVRKLQAEVDKHFESGEIDYAGLGKAKYLQACIDEALRLHPPVPSGTQRMTPAEGLEIGGTYIPGDTIVQIPIHTLQRDARNFAQPLEFIPERWTEERPGLVHNAEALMPFSVGPYACVGKQLGLMEIRAVTAHILREYDVRFAEGYRVEEFLAEKKDCFTLAVGPLRVVFDPRKK